MFNKFLICWSELRHSRKISAKQAESAIINAGLGICVRVVCECVCAFWCVWFMRLAGSLALRALHFFIRLPKQRHRRVHFLEQFTPPPPTLSFKSITLWWGVIASIFFFLLLLYCSPFASCALPQSSRIFFWLLVWIEHLPFGFWFLDLFLLMIFRLFLIVPNGACRCRCLYLLACLFILLSHLINFRFVIEIKYNRAK